MKKSIKDLGDIKGKKALVRVDVNVPLDADKNVTDDTRIQAILPTVNFLKEKGAKIILMAHLGRPQKLKEGQKLEDLSLAPVAKHMSKVLGEEVKFVKSPVGEGAEKELADLKDGQVALLENIRYYKAEEAKDDDMKFAEELAKLGDFYVNDAFGAAHRKHSSTAKVAKLLSPAVSGLLMEKELRCLSQALDNPTRPFTAVVGGAKVSSKIGVLENLLDKVDNMIIGGGMAYTFLKSQGYEVGTSMCELDQLDVAKEVLKKAENKGVKLYLPVDVVVADDWAKGENAEIKTVDAHQMPDGWEGVDAGEKTREIFADVLKNSKTILMNGPVGAFETTKFSNGTKAVLKAIVEATKDGATSVIGGGDSVSAAKQFFKAEDFTHVSTGGGASLEFIEGKVLPGVDALDEQ